MLPVSWLAGGLIGLRLDAEISIPAATTLVVIATGLLVATDARLPRGAVTTLAAAGGLFCGLLNGSAMASSGAGLRGVAGMVCSAFVVAALLSALAVSLRGGWPRIALRVAGSWISAIGILMLGWTLRGQL